MRKLFVIALFVFLGLIACSDPPTPVTKFQYKFEHHPAGSGRYEAWVFDRFGGGHCPPFNPRLSEEAWIAQVNAVLEANSIAPIKNKVGMSERNRGYTQDVDYEWPDHELGPLDLFTEICEDAAGRSYEGIWKVSIKVK